MYCIPMSNSPKHFIVVKDDYIYHASAVSLFRVSLSGLLCIYTCVSLFWRTSGRPHKYREISILVALFNCVVADGDSPLLRPVEAKNGFSAGEVGVT